MDGRYDIQKARQRGTPFWRGILRTNISTIFGDHTTAPGVDGAMACDGNRSIDNVLDSAPFGCLKQSAERAKTRVLATARADQSWQAQQVRSSSSEMVRGRKERVRQKALHPIPYRGRTGGSTLLRWPGVAHPFDSEAEPTQRPLLRRFGSDGAHSCETLAPRVEKTWIYLPTTWLETDQHEYTKRTIVDRSPKKKQKGMVGQWQTVGEEGNASSFR